MKATNPTRHWMTEARRIEKYYMILENDLKHVRQVERETADPKNARENSEASVAGWKKNLERVEGLIERLRMVIYSSTMEYAADAAIFHDLTETTGMLGSRSKPCGKVLGREMRRFHS